MIWKGVEVCEHVYASAFYEQFEQLGHVWVKGRDIWHLSTGKEKVGLWEKQEVWKSEFVFFLARDSDNWDAQTNLTYVCNTNGKSFQNNTKYYETDLFR